MRLLAESFPGALIADPHVGAEAGRPFFARPEELAALGLVRGQIPPIGRPLLPFDLVADPGVLEGEVVAFTAGSAADSIVMATADWRAVAAPRVAPLVAAR